MPAKAPIRLNIASRLDFVPPVCAIYLLAFIAAIFNPLPAWSVALAIAAFAAACFVHILDFSKSNNNVELTSVIFPDGKIQLESGKGRIFVGVLNGQQWCTRHVAVLRVMDRDRPRNLVILPGQRQDANEFRRLRVWLRQGLCNDAGAALRQ